MTDKAAPPPPDAADDIVRRLQGYNPPDRTVPSQQRIAQDIMEAATAIVALRERVAELERTVDARDKESCGRLQCAMNAEAEVARLTPLFNAACKTIDQWDGPFPHPFQKLRDVARAAAQGAKP